MTSYYMKLNQAMLVFFPSGSLDTTNDASAHESRVVQLVINTSRYAQQPNVLIIIIII